MSTSAVARPLRRIYLTGLVCAALAASVGIAIERARFGPNDETEALARVERSVRAEIDAVASALNDIASSVAREPALFDTAAADPAGARPLLDRADQALHGRTAGVFAVTAYRPSGAWPLAWSGVPSEIEVERIAGPETFFVAHGPLGLRLIYIKPVLDPVSGNRVGVIAAERLVSSSRGIHTAAPEEGVLSLPTLVPVTVRPHDPRATAPGFVIQSPLGQPLLIARVTPQAIQDTRGAMARKYLRDRARHSRPHADRRPASAAAVARSVPEAERSSQSDRRHSRAAGCCQVAAVVRPDGAVDGSGISTGRAGPCTPHAASHADRFSADHGHHRRCRRAGVRSRRTTTANPAPSPAAARKPPRVEHLCDHAAWGGRCRRFAARRLRSPARQCDLGDVGRRAALFAAPAGLGAPRVCARSAPRAGGRLLVRHRHRDDDDAAVARAAQRRHRAGCVRAAGASRSRHLDLSTRHRRRTINGAGCADRVRRARVSGACMGDGVGAAALPSRLAGAAAFRRRAGAADSRLRAVPVGAPFCRSRPAPPHRRRVRAPGQRSAARAAGQAAERTAADRCPGHTEPCGAGARAGGRIEHRVRNVGEYQPGDRAPRFVTRALRRRRQARSQVRVEPSRLCLDGAAMA